MRVICLAVITLLTGLSALAQSVFTERPDDPLAVYLTNAFGAHADGVADDSDALQRAIDRVQETTREGVVFIPQGRYRLGKTVYVWSGIRLIGYGAKRPIFVLGQTTPGYQDGPNSYMIWFTDYRSRPGQPIADASEFTFYSGLSNIDFELNDGNPAAVAIRFNVAQHSYISHAEFNVGTARAALEAIGNQASDIHVHGGDFGIVTGKTSPAWQFLLMDSSFDGQRTAAIRTHDAGFTLIRDRFSDVPVAIQIPAGEVEQLYGRDLYVHRVTQAALQLGDVKNLRNEITLENILCSQVPHFVVGAESLKADAAPWVSPPYYIEERLSAGLDIGADGREKGIALHHLEHRLNQDPKPVPTDIPSLPPMQQWINVHTLGVKGDGVNDDTAAIQRAVDAHSVLYFPNGIYRLTGTVRLRPDSVLIGFSPTTTQLSIDDSEAAFQGSGPAVGLLTSSLGGRTIVTGFGIATGNGNPRATGIDWRAGAHSMLDDVSFFRGRNYYNRALTPALPPPPPPASRPPMQLDAQYPSLWIHDGGGGILRDIWSRGGTAKAGLFIQNTDTPGVIYQFSCEHHMTKEARIEGSSHWKIYAFQTEEEKPEGAEALAVEIENSHDILFANTYMYRVSRNVMPKTYAVTTRNSFDIRFANVKVFSQTRLAFDNSVYDEGSKVAVRAHDFTDFVAGRDLKTGATLALPAAFEPKAVLTRIATGFSNASGLTVDSSGTLYFTDAAMHTIYRLPAGQSTPQVLAKVEQSPMSLGFAAPSALLAINNEKSVSAIDLNTGVVTPIIELPAAAAGTSLMLPVGLHNEFIQLQWLLRRIGYQYRPGSNTARRSGLLEEHRGYFYAPGTKAAVLAGGTWRPLLQSSQLGPFTPGDRRYIVSEDDGRTYAAKFGDGEALTSRTFANRGGTSVVEDSAGNVYIAGSQVYVYDRSGRLQGVLEIPERPSSLALGGTDRKILYIGARGSLYAIRTVAGGK